jgi:hypothetical protein
MKTLIQIIVLSFLLFSIFIPSCAKRPDPRNTVKKFIEAVDQSDTTATGKLLDFRELLRGSLEGISEKEKEELFPELRQNILKDLSGEGITRMTWKNSLLVVGKSEVVGDSATVEVTYINKLSGTKNYTKMGLHFIGGKWKIYNFKLEEMRL